MQRQSSIQEDFTLGTLTANLTLHQDTTQCIIAMVSPQHARHGHHQSLISDHESDGHYLSDIPGPPSVRTNEELNLSVISRYRSDAIMLEYVVPYVVVYTFSPESLAWEKSGMEGSTFLCRLSPNAEYDYRCAVIVLNRRGLDNLNIELCSNETVDITDEYVIIKHETPEQTDIYGLWVFREPPPSSTAFHPEAFAAKVQECVRRAEASRRKPAPAPQNDYQEQESSVPMGRQISLRELFGQQRQEDDTWSVRSHSPSRRTSNTHPTQQPIPEHFQTSNVPDQSTIDTISYTTKPYDKSGTSQTPTSRIPQPVNQQQTLLDLFRKSSEQRLG